MARKTREYTVAEAAELPPGSQRVVQVGRREIGVFNIGGTFHALPNLCPHQIGPLCTGKVSGTLKSSRENGWKAEWVHEGEILVCPWHGLEYHVPSGRCLAYPEIRLRSYEVWVEKGMVKLRL